MRPTNPLQEDGVVVLACKSLLAGDQALASTLFKDMILMRAAQSPYVVVLSSVAWGGRESQSRHCTYPIYTSNHQGIRERHSKLRKTLGFQDTSVTRGSITILHKVESFLINDTYLAIP